MPVTYGPRFTQRTFKTFEFCHQNIMTFLYRILTIVLHKMYLLIFLFTYLLIFVIDKNSVIINYHHSIIYIIEGHIKLLGRD